MLDVVNEDLILREKEPIASIHTIAERELWNVFFGNRWGAPWTRTGHDNMSAPAIATLAMATPLPSNLSEPPFPSVEGPDDRPQCL